MRLRLSRYQVATPPFTDPRDEREKRVVYSTRSARAIVMEASDYTVLSRGLLDELGDSLVHRLEKLKLLVPEDENELEAVLEENQLASKAYSTLYLVVQPTAACQFGCDYCGQLHRARQLIPRDQELLLTRAKEKLDTGSFDGFEVGWFGAEPLLGLRVMRSLSPKFRHLAKERDIKYWSRIVTNGFRLSSEIAMELAEVHAVQYVEITLDGIAEFHNSHRPTKGGKGTFDTIYGNLRDLVLRNDHPLEVGLRCNVDIRNRDGISPLLRRLADDGVLPKLKKLYFAPIHSWGNDADLLSMTPQEFASFEVQWFMELIELGFQPAMIPGRVTLTCMVQKPGAELVDAYGDLFNCSEVSYVPTYETAVARNRSEGDSRIKPQHVNVYSTGSLSAPPVRHSVLPFGDFFDRVRRGMYSCGLCEMLPVCGGACPKTWAEGKIPCPSTKYNLEQRLLLKQLSLIGQGDGYS